MRKVLVLAIALILGAAVPALADSMACGLKPLPPLGCSSSSAQCLCDAQGNCRWVFTC